MNAAHFIGDYIFMIIRIGGFWHVVQRRILLCSEQRFGTDAEGGTVGGFWWADLTLGFRHIVSGSWWFIGSYDRRRFVARFLGFLLVGQLRFVGRLGFVHRFLWFVGWHL